MKSKLHYLFLALAVGTIIMLFKSRTSEELVTESTPVSTLNFDTEVAKTPFETATFGMG